MLDDPMLIAWQQGHPDDDPANPSSRWRSWFDLIQPTVNRGVSVRRARIISEPVSEYIRFEYEMTVMNVAVGEDVRWLPRRKATDLALPGNDFWLFDDEVLLVNHFSGDGDAVGRELVTDAGTAELCATAFKAVWDRATPHAEYQPA
jgi:hypothetical protein